MFLSWGTPPFLLFYINFRPLLHPKYIKILIKAFLQSCIFGKYILFATLDIPVPVLGAEQLVFPCNVFFLAELQLKKFWAWAETKTGLCWGRIKANVSDKFQTLWIFNMFTCSYSIPWYIWPTQSWGLNLNMWICWISKVFEICQILFLLFCSCSELLQLKFSGEKKLCREIQIAQPLRQLQGCLEFQIKDKCHIYNFVERL